MTATYTQARRPMAVETPLGKDALLLTGFHGLEELSRPFAYRLEMQSTRASIDPAAVVGKPISFFIRNLDGSPRFFNGYVSRFAYAGRNDRLSSYRADVVPWLWFLTRSTNCRIFQEMTVTEIVKRIFDELGIAKYDVSQIKATHPRWEYCVQYRESHFDFISRLLEREGIFYYFRHENGEHTMVLADHAGAYQNCPEREVSFAAHGGAPDMLDQLTDWEHTYSFTNGKCTHTDFDFKSPTTNLLARTETVVPLPGNHAFEKFDYPGYYHETDVGTATIRMRMEQEEISYDIVNGGGRCRTFSPGGKFKITGHHGPAERNKGYVLTTVQHVARLGGSFTAGGQGEEQIYSNTFTCIPEQVVFRPERATPRPCVQGVQTATVVGPGGQEIHVDEFGRVKVQFHWDRVGQRDEHSSCWIRVSQPTAGKGWGTTFWPRIGQEVIVAFLEGDPDQPLVVGCVYNGVHLPPYPLPDHKTRSGIKTDSTLGSGGFNEIRFEDKKGSEQIFVHAERNQDVRIKHDSLHWIGNDQHHLVKHDRFEQVDGDTHLTVKGDQNEKVDSSVSLTVGQNLQQKIAMRQAVDAGTDIHLKAGMNVVIEAGMSITLKAGGGFIVVGPAGVTISGTPVLINSGGAADSGSGAQPASAKLPLEADDGTSGQKEQKGAPGAPDAAVSFAAGSVSVRPTFIEMMDPVEAAAYQAYWQRGAPVQVTPGLRATDDIKQSSDGVTQYRSVSVYDQFGRLEAQTHYTTHPNQLGEHPDPHYHVRNVTFGDKLVPGWKAKSDREWFSNPATGTKVFPGVYSRKKP